MSTSSILSFAHPHRLDLSSRTQVPRAGMAAVAPRQVARCGATQAPGQALADVVHDAVEERQLRSNHPRNHGRAEEIHGPAGPPHSLQETLPKGQQRGGPARHSGQEQLAVVPAPRKRLAGGGVWSVSACRYAHWVPHLRTPPVGRVRAAQQVSGVAEVDADEDGLQDRGRYSGDFGFIDV